MAFLKKCLVKIKGRNLFTYIQDFLNGFFYQRRRFSRPVLFLADHYRKLPCRRLFHKKEDNGNRQELTQSKKYPEVNLDCRFRSWYHCLSLCKLFHTPQKYVGVLRYINFCAVQETNSFSLDIQKVKKPVYFLKLYRNNFRHCIHSRGNIRNFIPGVRQQLLGLFHSVLCEVLI